MSEKQKEFYLILKGWRKVSSLGVVDWWIHEKTSYLHPLDIAYEMEMRQHDRNSD